MIYAGIFLLAFFTEKFLMLFGWGLVAFVFLIFWLLDVARDDRKEAEERQKMKKEFGEWV